MKNILLTLSILAMLLISFSAPVSAQTGISPAIIDVEANAEIPTVNASLTPEEVNTLLYMREEEKLARDVYLAMYDIWDLQLFKNIARAEQTHTDAVKTLIDRYGIADNFSAEYGVFINPDLQALYVQLVAQGSQSLGDAIKVGAAIEEIDILDLEESLAETDKADITRVYQNLLRGSYNHLRAFVSTLARQTGEVYAPQYMETEAYSEIVPATTPTGNPRRGGRRN